MGYLNTANDMVNNTMKVLDDVKNSKFSQFLQGNGTPALVTYYNIDEVTTTTETGSYTVDQILGANSPLRFNRIENFPIYGLRELIPSIESIDGQLFDLSMDTDMIILPGTIKPSAYDFFVYDFLDGNSITFQVTGFEFSSIKNNDYYKLSVKLEDINDDSTRNKLEKQVAKDYTVKLENVGSQDKCILENKVYLEIESINKVIKKLSDDYITEFYSDKYNSIIMSDSEMLGYTMYDPYLMTFIETNELLDNDDKRYILLSNYDTRKEVLRTYKKSFFKSLETRNIAQMRYQYYEPVEFLSNEINPFTYIGDEAVFTMDLFDFKEDSDIPYDDTYKWYVDKTMLAMISMGGEILPSTPSQPEVDDNELDDNTESDDTIVDDAGTGEDLYDDGIADMIDSGTVESVPMVPVVPLGIKPDFLKYIVTYMTKPLSYDLFDEDSLVQLSELEIEHNEIFFRHIPMLIFVLKKYLTFICNEKISN